ncbi:LacI family DNA-binding transcriptional regulator [Celeribacter halophilus]|uniref:LacI family DNA-binding transcriptional regulator n=1 Tax=Celeribacter halophilus TaxID=576117 RepID=UPI003A8E973E
MKKSITKRVTIRDLAQKAGTSISAASFVMNGSWERHRISAETAQRVQQAAQELGYQPSARARALRQGRSSLAGMIVPHHRNRFFAGLTEQFEAGARARGLVPIIGSTQRNPSLEITVAETLVAQDVEILVVAGVYDPSRINRLCRKRGVRCVNVDLPGPDSFSVVTDNKGGAYELTRRLLRSLPKDATTGFLGGASREYATELRLEGFRKALNEAGNTNNPAELCCGYAPSAAHDALETLYEEAGALPRALLINSITAFEGLATYWRDYPSHFSGLRVACFDWDPFAACLPIDTIMLRQDVEGLIDTCFEWFDAGVERAGEIVMLPPQITIEDPANLTSNEK